jgi:hypothetical protein
MAYGNGILVAVGTTGGTANIPRIAYSLNDGATWTIANTPHTDGVHLYRRVAYGNGKFIVVGGSGAMAQSTDGITWTAITSPTGLTGASIDSISFINGYFVAGGMGGQNAGNISYSTDGITWTLAAPSLGDSNPSIQSITHGKIGGNDMYIAVTRNGVIAFSDGRVRSFVTGVTVNDSEGLSVNNRKIAIREESDLSLTVSLSPAGISGANVTWEADPTGIVEIDKTDPFNVKITGLAEGETVITVSAANSDNVQPIAGPATASFTIGVIDKNAVAPIENMTVSDSFSAAFAGVPINNDDDIYLFVNEERTLNVSLSPVADLEEEITWTVTPDSGIIELDKTNPALAKIKGLAAGGPVTVTVTATNASTSVPFELSFKINVINHPTGDWTVVNTGLSGHVGGIAIGPNIWVVGGQSTNTADRLRYSEDNGDTWHPAVSINPALTGTDHIRKDAVAYLNGLFLAGTNAGLIYTSTDGKNWNIASSPGIAPGIILGFAYVNNQYIVFSNGGTRINISANGTAWESVHTAGGGIATWGGAFGDGKYIIGGAGVSFTENLGPPTTVWTTPAYIAGASGQVRSIAYGNGRFVSGSETNNTSGYSFNAVNWTGLNRNMLGVVFANGFFGSVASTGAVQYSTDGINWYPTTAQLTTVAAAAGSSAFTFDPVSRGFFVGGSSGQMAFIIPAP